MGCFDKSSHHIGNDSRHYSLSRAGAEINSAIGIGGAESDLQGLGNRPLNQIAPRAKLSMAAKNVADPRVVVQYHLPAKRITELFVRHCGSAGGLSCIPSNSRNSSTCNMSRSA